MDNYTKNELAYHHQEDIIDFNRKLKMVVDGLPFIKVKKAKIRSFENWKPKFVGQG